jgi:hypothetical protein
MAKIKKLQSANEIAADVMTFANICLRLGFDESVNNQKVFVEMINEAGFRTVSGKKFTYMSYRQMMNRLDDDFKRKIIAELCGNTHSETLLGHESIETYDEE